MDWYSREHDIERSGAEEYCLYRATAASERRNLKGGFGELMNDRAWPDRWRRLPGFSTHILAFYRLSDERPENFDLNLHLLARHRTKEAVELS